MKQQNPINIRLIDHVVIRVKNLEQMINFYSDVLGCRLERQPGEGRLAQLRAGSSMIDLAAIVRVQTIRVESILSAVKQQVRGGRDKLEIREQP